MSKLNKFGLKPMTESLKEPSSQMADMNLNLESVNNMLKSMYVPRHMMAEVPEARVSFTDRKFSTFNGIQIIEDPGMVDYVKDWSGCRSPSRAMRRLKRGFPQRMVVRAVPKNDMFVMGNRAIMHPQVAQALRDRVAKMADDFVEQQERGWF